MKKLLKATFFSPFIYFLFYILISTSGIMSVFYLLPVPINLFQEFFSTTPHFYEELNTYLFLGLPALGIVLISYMVIQRVKSKQVFFLLTFIIIAISHLLLFQSANIMGDIRLVMGAILYIAFLSFTLTILRQRIIREQNYINNVFLLILMIVMISINFIDSINFSPSRFFSSLYVAFAWNLNTIDYLFNKLDITLIEFVIVVVNIFACVSILTWYKLKSFLFRIK